MLIIAMGLVILYLSIALIIATTTFTIVDLIVFAITGAMGVMLFIVIPTLIIMGLTSKSKNTKESVETLKRLGIMNKDKQL